MKINMDQWLQDYLVAPVKKGIPILSFPGMQLIGSTVEELVKDGHLQALCMEAVAKRFDTGAAVSLMDLSVEAEAFGCPVRYSPDDVPTLHGAYIHNEEEAEALTVPEVGAGRTGECVRGIREASQLITDRPLLAGTIGPFSLAGRLLDMTEIMILCYEEPEMVETVLEKVTEFLIAYTKAFKEAGANGVVMAEPAAGLLSPSLMDDFSTPYVRRIIDAVEDENFIVMYHNCGNISMLFDSINKVNAKAYSFGNAIDIEDGLRAVPSDRMVIGNIDPAGIFRQGTPELVKQETLSLLERCSKYPNFVISSGCDIPPVTPLENIDGFFQAVDEFYKN